MKRRMCWMGNLLKMCEFHRCLSSCKRLLAGALWESVLLMTQIIRFVSSIKFIHEKWMGETADVLDSTNKTQILSWQVELEKHNAVWEEEIGIYLYLWKW